MMEAAADASTLGIAELVCTPLSCIVARAGPWPWCYNAADKQLSRIVLASDSADHQSAAGRVITGLAATNSHARNWRVERRGYCGAIKGKGAARSSRQQRSAANPKS